jgi:hypothetical protein
MSAQPGAGGLLARLRGADGRIPTRTRWIIAGAILILVIITSIAGIFWAIVALLGLAWLVFGLVAIFTGSASFVRLRSRWAGSLAIFVGLAALLVGGIGQGAVQMASNTTDASTTSGSVMPLAAVESATPTPRATSSATPSAPAKPKPTAAPKPTATPTPTPVATQAEVQEASAIPYNAVSVDDDTINVGASAVTTGGGNGEKVTTYLVEYVDGVEVSRSVAREEVTVQPVDEVTSIGTRLPAPVVVAEPVPENNGCDSNYADACVPIASDVDCAGGSGDGPGYVDGPVRIVGSDVYDLDRDGDGIACDS